MSTRGQKVVESLFDFLRLLLNRFTAKPLRKRLGGNDEMEASMARELNLIKDIVGIKNIKDTDHLVEGGKPTSRVMFEHEACSTAKHVYCNTSLGSLCLLDALREIEQPFNNLLSSIFLTGGFQRHVISHSKFCRNPPSF